MINQDVVVPAGYEVTRDASDAPVLQFNGKLTGYNKTTGAPEYDTKGAKQISAEQLQGVTAALQMKEMGQKTMQEYMSKQLGLNIKRQEGQIVSKEFEMELGHAGDQLQLDKDKFLSNEKFAEAEITGIFGEQNTLAKQDLMARLTGQVGTGEFEKKRKSILMDSGNTMSMLVNVEKTEDTIEMQRMKAELLG